MGFEPGLNIGDELSNKEMRELFQCGNMGGMRRSKKTGTLVIISDDTKGLYKDIWKDGILYYTGMGKVGNQVLEGNQNGTLYYSDTNGVEVHLFEVMRATVYTYRGIVKLANKPYQDQQLDDNGSMRKVWIFPVKPIEAVKEKMENPEEKEVKKLSVRELNRRSEITKGKRKPKKTESIVYYRDPYLKELVKRIAEGKCQFCGQDAPFIDNNNEPYLEEHHVTPLAEGGADSMENVVAICPNCHRKMHVLDIEEDRIVLQNVAHQNEEWRKRMMAYTEKSKTSKGLKHAK